MTREQALQLKVGDRVSIQRKGRPSPNLGTVYQIASEIRIQWDSYMWNGQEDGNERVSYNAGLMDRIERI
jgi:hypothetical protein